MKGRNDRGIENLQRGAPLEVVHADGADLEVIATRTEVGDAEMEYYDEGNS